MSKLSGQNQSQEGPAAANLLELGIEQRRLGQTDQAAETLLKAVKLEPDLAEASFHLGLTLTDQEDRETALLCFERAAEIKPDDYAIQCHLASALGDRGELERAVGHYQCALALKPRAVEVHVALASLHHRRGRLEGAIAHNRHALELEPHCAKAHNQLAFVRLENYELDEAIVGFGRAVELDSGFAAAHANLGSAFRESGELDKAMASYERALELGPENPAYHSNLLFLLPFHPGFDDRTILERARQWSRVHEAPLAAGLRPHANSRNPERRLRIGYVSSHFRNHCQSFFTLPLLRHHDREAFDVFCYASVSAPDLVTEDLHGNADAWRNIDALEDIAAADLVRGDEIDILVDLTMHMGGSRLGIFAHKPAPVQVCWLAYPGTTGLDAIDYRITDPFLDPNDADLSVYSETSLRLPDTFWCYDPLGEEPDISALPAIENGFVTFGCLNNFVKINEATLRLWARLLLAVSRSRLVLLAPSGSARDRTANILRACGVDSERVTFVDRQPRRQYLETYRRIDIGLDPFPYNGHTTSLDSFWMGVPVVTLVGNTIVGRAGLGQAMNLGLPELVAKTPDEFSEQCIALTRDLGALATLRAGLRARMRASPLMDAPRFARNLESAYRDAWRRWCETGTARTS